MRVLLEIPECSMNGQFCDTFMHLYILMNIVYDIGAVFLF